MSNLKIGFPTYSQRTTATTAQTYGNFADRFRNGNHGDEFTTDATQDDQVIELNPFTSDAPAIPEFIAMQNLYRTRKSGSNLINLTESEAVEWASLGTTQAIPSFGEVEIVSDAIASIQNIPSWQSTVYNYPQGTTANRPSLSCGSELFENQIVCSDNGSLSPWYSANSTRTLESALTPNGYPSYSLTDNATNGFHSIIQNVASLAGQTWRISFVIKAEGLNYIAWLRANSGSSRSFVLDLTTGIASSASNVVVTTEDLGGGWWRVVGTGADVNTATNANWRINAGTTSSTFSYPGSSTKAFSMGEAVFQVLGADDVYIPTRAYKKMRGANGACGISFDGDNDSLGPPTSSPDTWKVSNTNGLWGGAVIRLQPGQFSTKTICQTATGSDHRIYWYVTTAGGVAVYVHNGDANYIARTAPDGTVVPGQTTVLSFNYTGGTAATDIEIFKSGVQVDTASLTGGSYTTPGAGSGLIIGGTSSNFFSGEIFEFQFINQNFDPSTFNADWAASRVALYVTTPLLTDSYLEEDDTTRDQRDQLYLISAVGRDLSLRLSTQARGERADTQYPIGRPIMGDWFEFSRDPLPTQRELLDYGNGRYRQPVLTLTLDWDDLTNAEIEEFVELLSLYQNTSPVVVYTEVLGVLRDRLFDIMWISSMTREEVSHNSNNISVTFRRAI